MCTSAYQLVQSSLPLAIFNHSLRVYIYALTLARRTKCPWASPSHQPLLFVACLFHDMGCSHTDKSPERFEVCGADAAAAHLHKYSVSEADIHEVWTAIALHTSPGIAERVNPLARIMRLAPLMDFHALEGNPWVSKAEKGICEDGLREGIEERWPRLEIEKVLGDVVVEQGLKQSTKAAPSSWAGDLIRAKREEPEWKGVNRAF